MEKGCPLVRRQLSTQSISNRILVTCKAVRTLSQEGLHQTLCVGQGHTRVHITSGWWELHWSLETRSLGRALEQKTFDLGHGGGGGI